MRRGERGEVRRKDKRERLKIENERKLGYIDTNRRQRR